MSQRPTSSLASSMTARMAPVSQHDGDGLGVDVDVDALDVS
jgi:hypothetical protein